MKIRKRMLLCWIGLGSLLGWVGCGVPEYSVELHMVQRALVQVTSYKLWVIKDKLTDGKAITCAELLKSTSFDPSKFDKENTQDIQPDGLQNTSKHETNAKLSAGKKLFVAAGFGDKAAETDPASVGCTEGEITGGERLYVSVFLATRK